jgi:hypothetical protein
MDEQFATLKAQLSLAEQEYLSLKAGRKSAAPRLRKSLMALKTGSHALRASTTGFVRELPTKSRQPTKAVAEPEPEPEPEETLIKPEKSKRTPRKKKPVESE